MTRSIRPVLEYEADEGYPNSHGVHRRSFLRLALLGAVGSLGGCIGAAARGNHGKHTLIPPANPPPLHPAPRLPTRPAAPAPLTYVVISLRAALGRRVIVRSDDPRFLRFLTDPGRQAYLQRYADPSNPNRAAGPTGRENAIGRRLVSYFRMRTGRRTAQPRITLLRPRLEPPLERLFEEGDPPSALGVPRPPQ